jgi:hypothetical protein
MMASTTSDTNGYVAAKRFLRDHPSWLPVLSACLKESKRTAGGFAGAWVRQAMQQQADCVQWFPNLRPLVSAGILRRTGVSRGGKRAYYEMVDEAGVAAALTEELSRETLAR